METVKGQGMELPSEWRWEKLYSGKIEAGFRNTITSTAAGSANQFMGQVSGLIVIWLGAMLVLEGEFNPGPTDRLPHLCRATSPALCSA